MTDKVCTKCEESKPLADFPPRGEGYQSQCRQCKAEYHREYYRTHPEKRAQHLVAVAINNKARIARTYGMTVEEHETFKLRGMCELCGERPGKVVDHDHETGVVRGWLCISCNVGLGKMGDNVAGLKRAIEYLQRHVA